MLGLAESEAGLGLDLESKIPESYLNFSLLFSTYCVSRAVVLSLGGNVASWVCPLAVSGDVFVCHKWLYIGRERVATGTYWVEARNVVENYAIHR